MGFFIAGFYDYWSMQWIFFFLLFWFLGAKILLSFYLLIWVAKPVQPSSILKPSTLNPPHSDQKRNSLLTGLVLEFIKFSFGMCKRRSTTLLHINEYSKFLFQQHKEFWQAHNNKNNDDDDDDNKQLMIYFDIENGWVPQNTLCLKYIYIFKCFCFVLCMICMLYISATCLRWYIFF